MTNPSVTQMIPIRDFAASKQIALFKTLKQPQFSGKLFLQDTKGRVSLFYLYMGRLMYGTGGIHPVRRWLRNLVENAPKISLEINRLKNERLSQQDYERLEFCWDYDLLRLWLEQGKISREQVTQIVRGILVDMFFDLTQAGQVTYKFEQVNNLPPPLILIDTDRVVVDSWKAWQAWQEAKLADRSPNSSPVVKQPQQLKERTSPNIYQILSKLLSKKETLRDLAIEVKPDIVQLTRLIMPYVQLGFIELQEIPDLTPPIPLPRATDNQSNSHTSKNKSPLIACVDDSSPVLETVESVVAQAGYEFLGISEVETALAKIAESQPDLIFVDADIPNLNSYQLCNDIHQLPQLQNVPIVILSDSYNILDRVKSKVFGGASESLSKPINNQQILKMIEQYLKNNYSS